MVIAGRATIVVDTDVKNFKKGMKGAKKGVGDFATFARRALIGIGLIAFFKSAVTEAVRFENAMMGLSSVSRSFAIDANEATGAAQSLSEDGLLAVHEAAEGLKNLLATGFSMPQAIDLMNTFKDSAAFNRQGMLEFGQAIIGATQGIKNQNSIMVDNVGITKNLSMIMKEAGFTLQDLSDETNKAAAMQALYNGLMKEGSMFQGDAASAVDTAQGAFSKWNTAVRDLKIGMADMFMPALIEFTQLLTDNEDLYNSVALAMEVIAKAILTVVTAIVINIKFAIEMIKNLKAELKGDDYQAAGPFMKPLFFAEAATQAGGQAAGTTSEAIGGLWDMIFAPLISMEEKVMEKKRENHEAELDMLQATGDVIRGDLMGITGRGRESYADFRARKLTEGFIGIGEANI